MKDSEKEYSENGVLKNLVLSICSLTEPTGAYNKKGISRKDIDDYARRNSNNNSYKNRYFAGKQMAHDEYTGRKIHFRLKTGTKRFKSVNTAQTDHVIPLDKIIKQYGEKIFLSKDNLRTLSNNDYNLAMTNGNLNMSKQNKTNIEYINMKKIDFDVAQNMRKKQSIAENYMSRDIRIKQIENTVKTVGTGAKNALMYSVVPMAVDIVKKMYYVKNGELEVDEAIKDVLNNVTITASIGGGTQILAELIKSYEKIPDKVKKILEKDGNFFFMVLGVVFTLKDPIISYAKGDIDTQDFEHKVIKNVSSLMANVAGRTAGVSIATAIAEAIGCALGNIATGGVALVGAAAGEALVNLIDNIVISVQDENSWTEIQKNQLKNMSEQIHNEYTQMTIVQGLQSSSDILKRYSANTEGINKLEKSIMSKNMQEFTEGLNIIATEYGASKINPYEYQLFKQYCMM